MSTNNALAIDRDELPHYTYLALFIDQTFLITRHDYVEKWSKSFCYDKVDQLDSSVAQDLR